MLVFLSPLNYNNISEVRMDILDLIESFVGISNTFLQMLLAIGFIGAIGIGLSLVGVPKILIFATIVVAVLMFAGFGWIPIWIVVMVAIGIFTMAFFSIRGGSNV
jgi:hypothetical protein